MHTLTYMYEHLSLCTCICKGSRSGCRQTLYSMSTSVFCLTWRKEKKRMSLALARADSGLSDARGPHSRARPVSQLASLSSSSGLHAFAVPMRACVGRGSLPPPASRGWGRSPPPVSAWVPWPQSAQARVWGSGKPWTAAS
jgi:hypothetical protein